MPRRRHASPTDPMKAMIASAEQRARERQAANDPANWGVEPTLKKLPTSRAVKVTRGPRARILAAHRQDAFDALHARGGLTDGQHQAARRLIRDWADRLGVGGAGEELGQAPGPDADPELAIDKMIKAGRRVEAALRGVGPASAELLAALIEPIVLQGVLTWWRGKVQRVTGEEDPTAQGARVREACENLRRVYGMPDPANDNRPGRIHPFHPAA